MQSREQPRTGRLVFGASLLAAAWLGASSGDLVGQVHASPLGTVSQTIDGTEIEVRYSRPAARGRELFGNLIDWGYMWTPGANWATRLRVTRPVHLEGRYLPRGDYSLWFQAGPDRWTINVHPNPVLFHTGEYPSPEDFQLSFGEAPVDPGHYAEMLTFSFPAVRPDGGTLRMHWGETAIDLDIAVMPTMTLAPMHRGEAAPYLGRYSGTVEFPGGDVRRDAAEVALDDDGLLVMRLDELGFALHLVPTGGPHEFALVAVRDGGIFNVEQEPVRFEMGPDGARRLAARGIRDEMFFDMERVR